MSRPSGWAQTFWEKVRANASVAVVAASQILAAEASADCPAEEQLAEEQAPAIPTNGAVTPPGSLPATA